MDSCQEFGLVMVILIALLGAQFLLGSLLLLFLKVVGLSDTMVPAAQRPPWCPPVPGEWGEVSLQAPCGTCPWFSPSSRGLFWRTCEGRGGLCA